MIKSHSAFLLNFWNNINVDVKGRKHAHMCGRACVGVTATLLGLRDRRQFNFDILLLEPQDFQEFAPQSSSIDILRPPNIKRFLNEIASHKNSIWLFARILFKQKKSNSKFECWIVKGHLICFFSFYFLTAWVAQIDKFKVKTANISTKGWVFHMYQNN